MTNGNSAGCQYCDGTGSVHRIDGEYLGECTDCPASVEHQFKNFHSRLCERFGYTHDEVDWKRDQVSLIEWIAKQVDGGNSAERERFEDWFKKPHGLPLTSTTARVMWEAWQARAALSARADGGKGEAVALWAAFAPEGNLLAHSKLRPGLSDILNWEPLYRAAPQAERAPRVDADIATCQNCNGTGCLIFK